MLKPGSRVKATGGFDGKNHEWTGIVIKVNRKTFHVLRDGVPKLLICEMAGEVPHNRNPAVWPIGFYAGDVIHLDTEDYHAN